MTVTARDLLQPALANSGMSRRALAAATGSSVAGLNEVFHGEKDATVGRVSRLLEAMNHQLIVIPTNLPTVSQVAEHVRERLERDQRDNAIRVVLQLAEDLRSAELALRIALCLTPPSTTGNARFDALITGVADMELSRDNLALPRWIHEHVPLDPPWDVETVPALQAEGRANTHPALARHGVYFEEQSLVNV